MTSSIDLPALLEQFGDAREILDQVIDTYLEQYPQLLAEVGRAVATRDPAALSTSAHKFKGALSIFAVERAVEPAAFLELAGKTGNLEHIDAMSARLEREVERLGEELKRLRQQP